MGWEIRKTPSSQFHGQFSRHEVGLSSYITNLSDKQASQAKQQQQQTKNKKNKQTWDFFRIQRGVFKHP